MLYILCSQACVKNEILVLADISCFNKWAPSSEFVSSSIPSWQILTAHAQPFRGARDLAFCLTVPLDSLLVWASSEGSGETARMRRLAWTFAARIGNKYQIRLTRSKCFSAIWKKWIIPFLNSLFSNFSIIGCFTKRGFEAFLYNWAPAWQNQQNGLCA